MRQPSVLLCGPESVWTLTGPRSAVKNGVPTSGTRGCVIHRRMLAPEELADASGAAALAAGPAPCFRAPSFASLLLPTLSVAAALGVWELISRTGTISAKDLPAMSTSVRALWTMLQTEAFWGAFLHTVRGWAVGLGVASTLAVPIGIGLGSSEFAARAFRVPIEFL